uniref:Uncharacterized protein n=1 Tax=Romanomermis culicivorax TaxID=13658 RepID=A0A915ICN7_ROMCU
MQVRRRRRRRCRRGKSRKKFRNVNNWSGAASPFAAC